MEIILRQDVVNLGYKNDIVKVKDGYANNFLIPKGLAIMATTSAKKVREEDIKQQAFKEDKLKIQANAMAEALANVSLKITAKAGENNKLFGSVTSQQIAEALKEQYKHDIDRKKIHITNDVIKELGSYTAKVSIYREITAEIAVEVIAE